MKDKKIVNIHGKPFLEITTPIVTMKRWNLPLQMDQLEAERLFREAVQDRIVKCPSFFSFTYDPINGIATTFHHPHA